MNRYGQANTNSRMNKAKREAITGNKFLDFAAKQAESEIEYGHYDAGMRLVTFIGEHFVDESECEGVCDYLTHLMEAMQEAERAAMESPAVKLYQAQEQLKASQESRSAPAPHFGTIERAEYDNERRIRSEAGKPITSKTEFQASLRSEIAELKGQIT